MNELFRVIRDTDAFLLVPAANFGDWDVLAAVVAVLADVADVIVVEAEDELVEVVPPRKGRPYHRRSYEIPGGPG